MRALLATYLLAEFLVVAISFFGLMTATESWQTLLAAGVFLVGTVAVVAAYLYERRRAGASSE